MDERKVLVQQVQGIDQLLDNGVEHLWVVAGEWRRAWGPAAESRTLVAAPVPLLVVVVVVVVVAVVLG